MSESPPQLFGSRASHFLAARLVGSAIKTITAVVTPAFRLK